MDKILFALWFFLPGGLANGSAVFGTKLPLIKKLSQPMDFGKSWRGQRIFGPNKTLRGLIMGILVGTVVIVIQKIAYAHIGWIREISSPVDYSQNAIWWLGGLMGAGALLGDAVESFFKRQVGIAAGRSWVPFDQVDYIIGGCLLSLFVVRTPFLGLPLNTNSLGYNPLCSCLFGLSIRH